MLDKPRLKTYLTIFPISSTAWGLRGGEHELWRLDLKNERALAVFGAVLPHLTGERSRPEIQQAVAEQGITAGEVDQLIVGLAQRGLLEEGDGARLPAEVEERFSHQISFFSRFSDQGGAGHQRRLIESTVTLVGEGALAGALGRQLEGAGIGGVRRLELAGGGRPALLAGEGLPKDSQELVLVTQEGFDPELVEAINGFALERRFPWLLVRILSLREAAIGPFFLPGSTACLQCLEAREASHRGSFDEHRALAERLREIGQGGARCGGLQPFFEAVAGIAATEVVKFLTDFAAVELAGRYLTFELGRWRAEPHEVLRLPRCAFCHPLTPEAHPWKEVTYGK
ncbi:MAG: TOMM precursor leader peptide-binding protein [Acidobacteriota bacterium]